jgi:hypothetical protein
MHTAKGSRSNSNADSVSGAIDKLGSAIDDMLSQPAWQVPESDEDDSGENESTEQSLDQLLEAAPDHPWSTQPATEIQVTSKSCSTSASKLTTQQQRQQQHQPAPLLRSDFGESDISARKREINGLEISELKIDEQSQPERNSEVATLKTLMLPPVVVIDVPEGGVLSEEETDTNAQDQETGATGLLAKAETSVATAETTIAVTTIETAGVVAAAKSAAAGTADVATIETGRAVAETVGVALIEAAETSATTEPAKAAVTAKLVAAEPAPDVASDVAPAVATDDPAASIPRAEPATDVAAAAAATVTGTVTGTATATEITSEPAMSEPVR